MKTKHGLEKPSIFALNVWNTMNTIASTAAGKYRCKCGMTFDTAEMFNKHLTDMDTK